MEARRHLRISVANLATQCYGDNALIALNGWVDTAQLAHGVIVASSRQDEVPGKLTSQLYSVWRDRTRGFRIHLLGTEFGICRHSIRVAGS